MDKDDRGVPIQSVGSGTSPFEGIFVEAGEARALVETIFETICLQECQLKALLPPTVWISISSTINRDLQLSVLPACSSVSRLNSLGAFTSTHYLVSDPIIESDR